MSLYNTLGELTKSAAEDTTKTFGQALWDDGTMSDITDGAIGLGAMSFGDGVLHRGINRLSKPYLHQEIRNSQKANAAVRKLLNLADTPAMRRIQNEATRNAVRLRGAGGIALGAAALGVGGKTVVDTIGRAIDRNNYEKLKADPQLITAHI